MNKTIQTTLDNLWSGDRELQNKAFCYILQVTDKPVDWAYEVWDGVVENLTHKDNHNRAIAAQVLCNLAKSDPKNRMLKDFKALLAVTKDERLSLQGTVCNPYGKSAPQERNNKSSWWTGLQVALGSAPPKKTAP